MAKKRKELNTPATSQSHQNYISISNNKHRGWLERKSQPKQTSLLYQQINNMINSQFKHKRPANPNFFKTTVKNFLKEIRQTMSQKQQVLNIPSNKNLTQSVFFHWLLKMTRELNIWWILFDQLNTKLLQMQEFQISGIYKRKKIRLITNRVIRYLGLINVGQIKEAFEICFGRQSQQKYKMYALNLNNEGRRKRSSNSEQQQ